MKNSKNLHDVLARYQASICFYKDDYCRSTYHVANGFVSGDIKSTNPESIFSDEFIQRFTAEDISTTIGGL